MTKIAVFSDTHGNSKNMLTAITLEKPDIIFHLGDGETDLETVRQKYPDIPIRNVRGNCDKFSSSPAMLCFELEGLIFFLVHGNEHRAKRDTISAEMAAAAIENSADVVLYGHTHRPLIEETIGFTVMNPGTCKSCPSPSYGIITIDDEDVSVNIRYIEPGESED